MLIKITQRPAGEAPEWVRDAWIGLSLPTKQPFVRNLPNFGVLSGPTNSIIQIRDVLLGRARRTSGYIVSAKIAVDLLAQTQPAAAQWWRDNAPKLLSGKRDFLFDIDACEEAWQA